MQFITLIRLFVSILFAVTTTSGYITRLSDRVHARFDSKLVDTYVTGTLVEAISETLNETMCIMYCMAESQCEFINHKTDNSQCDLMKDLLTATKANSPGWNYLSTNHTTKNKGQYCQTFDPCGYSEKCHDVDYATDPKGYQCTSTGPNVALNKPMWCANGANMWSQAGITDGIIDSGNAHCGPDLYWRIDFGQSYLIDFVQIHAQRQSSGNEYSLEVHLGNDPVATDANTRCSYPFLPYNNEDRWFVCHTDIPGQISYRNARYIFLQWAYSIPTYLYIYEIIAYEKID